MVNNIIDAINIQSISSAIFSILTITLTLYLTNFFNTRTTKNEVKYELQKKSFENVYLPLYKMIKDIKYSELDINDYYNKILIINNDYIEYTNPILNHLLYKLKKAIDQNIDKPWINPDISYLNKQIRKQYKVLSKKLGYIKNNIFYGLSYEPIEISLLSYGIFSSYLAMVFMFLGLSIKNLVIQNYFIAIFFVLIIISALLIFLTIFGKIYNIIYDRIKKRKYIANLRRSINSNNNNI